MPIFDRYIAVDWSGSNSPSSGADSIWIGESRRSPNGIRVLPSVNPRTRHAAMELVRERIADARSVDERLLIGFDFAFGYPKGATRLISGTDDWRSLWRALSALVFDDASNKSNNYAVADTLNAGFPSPGPRFWGRPAALAHANLLTKKTGAVFDAVPERRLVECVAKGTKAIWQLHYNGSVGSQALLGIPRLEALRSQVENLAIWPFETDFDRNLTASVVVAEIYPSLFRTDEAVVPLDRAQVEAVAAGFARFDAEDRLTELLASPEDLTPAERQLAVTEEGWIVGAGRTDLKAERAGSRGPPAVPARPPTYLRDPDAIYAQSFATIRAEADLSHLPPALHDVAIRMIHACGMVDLSADIVGDRAIVEAVASATGPILCDCEMVRSGIIRRYLPQTAELVVTLNDPSVPDLANTLGTTRSAAAVELWRPRLEGSIVVIGNAPTALFHLLEMLAAGAPRPAAIIAAPVGFVGAAESKALLVADSFSIPFVTVTGRRGGSAIASAAFNAISKGAWA